MELYMRQHVRSDPKKNSVGQLSARSTPTSITAEQRHQMIAEAAYFMAADRGFQNGCELDDWLCAEAVVDKRLSGTAAS
jgi:hypothetical protein